MPKTYSLLFEEKIKKAYSDGLEINKIIKKYNCTSTYINKVRIKYNLTRHTMNQSGIFNKFNILRKIPFISTSNKKEYKYILNCSCCNKESDVVISQLNRLVKTNKQYTCNECSLSFDTRVVRASQQNKRIDNKTGYIGVCVNQYKDKIIGYVATLNSKGITIFRNKYKDEALHNKTLTQAAIDRDIFIVEHKLTHRRNFTDLELFANMEYLAYDNINTLKEKLSK